MKIIHTITEPIQFPQLWDEKCLRMAIDEIDTRSMTPDELYHYEKTLAQNAQVVWDERRKIDKVKTSAIKKALVGGKLTIDEITDYWDVTTDFVIDIQNKLTGKQ